MVQRKFMFILYEHKSRIAIEIQETTGTTVSDIMKESFKNYLITLIQSIYLKPWGSGFDNRGSGFDNLSRRTKSS